MNCLQIINILKVSGTQDNEKIFHLSNSSMTSSNINNFAKQLQSLKYESSSKLSQQQSSVALSSDSISTVSKTYIILYALEHSYYYAKSILDPE